ncbi:Yip1-domain-containing protein [Fistulina hepatica ATCC 64428]|uniref:Yip1-domain-containing protein n=1 Tax=Fistulina hepatica ATCC 64428 TaxID=1128425 RepID=A0A0D7AEU3_9AGAR|nr:Yip1-domain-containing protein [Fistulina hepatica ATCC 64428]
MAYIAVEADERLEEGPQGLQFQTFIPSNQTNGNGVGNTDRGYLQDRPAASSGFWTLDYYQQYFDVDTKSVLKRCCATLLLNRPFWTLTTLICTLYLSSSLAASIAAYLSADGAAYEYDFGLLSRAVVLVYAYGLGLPVLFWLALRYVGVGAWGPVEALALWGYSQFVWIPVSILCVIPVAVVRWALVGVAFAMSTWFLVANVYPVLAQAEAKAVRLSVVVVVALQAALALCFMLMFFGYYVTGNIGPDVDITQVHCDRAQWEVPESA